MLEHNQGVKMFRPSSTLFLSKDALKNLTKEGYLFAEDIENITENDGIDQIPHVSAIKSLTTPPISLSALDHWQAELQYDRFTTFSGALDDILDGGIQCGMITEICGPSGSGKTQLCFQIAITVQLPHNQGGLAGGCLYVDTRNTFSKQRIQDFVSGCQKMCPNMNLNPEAIARNITVISPGTSNELSVLMKKLRNYTQSSVYDSRFRAIIIDSLSFSPTSMDNSLQKNSYYIEILDELQKLASMHNIAVVIVNELVTQVEKNGEICFESAGGQVVASRCSKRLMLARINNVKFAAKLLKSSTMSKVAILFRIGAEGIRDEIIK